MTRAFTAIVLGGALLTGGCADEIEQQTVNDVPNKFQRGITGEGQLGPRDRTDDPYVKPRNGDPQQQ